MSSARLALVLFFVFRTTSAVGQQSVPAPPSSSPPSSTQGVPVLQRALAALAPSSPISDVTLNGTARHIAGSDDESGTVVLKASAATGSRLDLALPSGPASEIRNISTSPPIGSWSGPDGVFHATTYPNLLTDRGWFPAFTIASLLSAQNTVITFVGPETHNGQSLIHVSASQQFPLISGDSAALMEHFTQMDIYLDPATNLPAAVAFNIHADNNALLDIPVEIRFSSYQAVSGAQIPFHVQKFINDGLALDLQFSSATLNSGLSATIFEVQ